MPQNGYWIECVPVSNDDKDVKTGMNSFLYQAMIAAIPEIKALARTPHNAIEELRAKLDSLRTDYDRMGKHLPEHDNPIRPPRYSRSVKGRISVYVNVGDAPFVATVKKA